MTSTWLKADTIIRNANIITMDPRQPHAQAAAILDGKFIGVGSAAELTNLVGPNTRVLDLTGKTVLPGFIDAHIHVLNSGIRHVMAADCDLPTITAIQTALRERVETTAPGQWVQGFKFDDTKTVENRFLFREDLDAVSTFHPIMVSHRAGHIYYLNTAALEAAGFTRDTPDPFGGRLGRDPDTGELNGVVYERAIEPVRFGLIPSDTPEIRREGLRTICRMLTQAGLTSVHDARVIRDEFVTYQEGRDAGELSMRVYALMYYPHFPSLREAGFKTGFGDNMLRLGGIKMVADGAIAARTAYLSEPYIGSDCDHGILAMSAEEIEENVMEMHRAGFQVCIHANGDLTIDMVLNAYEKAQAADPRPNPRHRVEHCTLVNPEILARCAGWAPLPLRFAPTFITTARRCPSTARSVCSGCSRSVRSWTTVWWPRVRRTILPVPSSRCWASKAASREPTAGARSGGQTRRSRWRRLCAYTLVTAPTPPLRRPPRAPSRWGS